MKRIQFNIRMDNDPELYEEVKKKADLLNTSINEFAISALSNAVGWKMPVDGVAISKKIVDLDKRVKQLEKNQLAMAHKIQPSKDSTC